MRTPFHALALAPMLALSLSGAADAARRSPDAELAQLIGKRVADTPVNCIDPSLVRSTRIIEGRAIVYDMGSRLYVNRPGGAEHLRDDDVPVNEIFGGQLCRLDTVRLISRAGGFQHGFVVLGDFVPYRKPQKAERGSPGGA